MPGGIARRFLDGDHLVPSKRSVVVTLRKEPWRRKVRNREALVAALEGVLAHPATAGKIGLDPATSGHARWDVSPIEPEVKVHHKDLSFQEEVALFSQAAVAVGLYSAGLTNMLFMPWRAHIFVLHIPRSVGNSQYTQMATLLEQIYHEFRLNPEDAVCSEELILDRTLPANARPSAGSRWLFYMTPESPRLDPTPLK